MSSFDEKHASKIAEAVESALQTNNETLLLSVATKSDVTELRTQMAETKSEIIKWMKK